MMLMMVTMNKHRVLNIKQIQLLLCKYYFQKKKKGILNIKVIKKLIHALEKKVIVNIKVIKRLIDGLKK